MIFLSMLLLGALLFTLLQPILREMDDDRRNPDREEIDALKRMHRRGPARW